MAFRPGDDLTRLVQRMRTGCRSDRQPDRAWKRWQRHDVVAHCVQGAFQIRTDHPRIPQVNGDWNGWRAQLRKLCDQLLKELVDSSKFSI